MQSTPRRTANFSLLLLTFFLLKQTAVMAQSNRHGSSQLEVRTDYVGTSDVRNSDGKSQSDDGTPYGKADLWKTSLRYTTTLSAATDSAGRSRLWTATFAGFYCRQTGEGEASERNPEDVVAATFAVTHVRSLSEHWRMMASASIGLAGPTDEIALRSILANVACLFTYDVNRQMSLTVGGAMTNLYGVPIPLPMVGFSYRTSGRQRFGLDMLPRPRLTATADLSRSFGICLTAIEMDGVAAVVKRPEGTRLYSTTLMRSYLSPTLRLSRQSSLYLSVGINYLRTTRLSRRSYDGFFRSFSSDSEKRRFRPTLLLGGGVKFSF